MSKAKQIGTTGETRVVNWLHQYGFARAERLVLKGSNDQSDIMIDPDIPGVIEMKWRSPARGSDGVKRRTASTHTLKDIKGWLNETVVEAANRGPGNWGVLMVNEFGKSDPGDWRVYVPGVFSESRILVPPPSPDGLRVGLGEFNNWATVMMTGRDFAGWLFQEYPLIPFGVKNPTLGPEYGEAS